MTTTYDSIVIGGGPGGLNAALILGRSQRKTLLLDSEDKRRNMAATHLHNFVSRDGVTPQKFREESREQLAHYPSIEIKMNTWATKIERLTQSKPHSFQVTVQEGDAIRQYISKFVVLAVGVIDHLNETGIKNLEHGWGESIFTCPYCHGYENRGQWGVIVNHPIMFEMAKKALAWSTHVTLFNSYPSLTTSALSPSPDQLSFFKRAKIQVETRKVVSLEYSQGSKSVCKAVLEDGSEIPIQALMYKPSQTLPQIVLDLKLELDPLGYVKVNPMTKQTSLEGLFAVGDVSTMMQQALTAATDGLLAGVNINTELIMASVPEESA